MMLLNTAISAIHRKEEYKGTLLDLTYITPNLIASAMPTESYLQSFYRTSLALMIEFLNSKHPNHWHIWNLQQDCELGYDPDSVVDQNGNSLVTRVPTPDHHPPTMQSLISTARDIHSFLGRDHENIAVIHCKCGKGRTGSVIVAYLMLYHGMSSERAQLEFTRKRMRSPLIPAVSIASQRRFLGYLERNKHLLDSSYVNQQPSFVISHLIIRNPKLEKYNIKVKSLSHEEPSICDWHITVTGNYHLLKYAGSHYTLMPPDLVLEFVGYKTLANISIPVSSLYYPFNVVFEENNAITHSQCIKSPSFHPALTGESGSVYCPWDKTDGLGGLPLRGSSAFDSVEVYWNRSQPQISEQCFSKQVPNTNCSLEYISKMSN